MSSHPVLVTGGAGLLGSAVVYQLLARGEQKPVVLDLAANPGRLAHIINKIDYVCDDFSRPGVISELISRLQPSRIFHLGAALGQACEDNPVLAQKVNVEATFELFEAARRAGTGQVLFASSVATFGLDLPENILRDNCLQRPISFYGVTKLYGEGAGLFFRRKYGLDFRSLRYPFIVGPGARLGGVIDYPTAMIVKGIKGESYTANVPPATRIHYLHVGDAARALLELAAAPAARIKTVNYLVDGVRPALSAGEIAELVNRRFPEARFSFEPDERLEPIIEKVALPIDDSRARDEWGWEPRYDYQRIIDDFIELHD